MAMTVSAFSWLHSKVFSVFPKDGPQPPSKPPVPPPQKPPPPGSTPTQPKGPVQVRRDYNPKAAQAQAKTAPAGSEQYLVSPITGEKIPASKMEEHMRYGKGLILLVGMW